MKNLKYIANRQAPLPEYMYFYLVQKDVTREVGLRLRRKSQQLKFN